MNIGRPLPPAYHHHHHHHHQHCQQNSSQGGGISNTGSNNNNNLYSNIEDAYMNEATLIAAAMQSSSSSPSSSSPTSPPPPPITIVNNNYNSANRFGSNQSSSSYCPNLAISTKSVTHPNSNNGLGQHSIMIPMTMAAANNQNNNQYPQQQQQRYNQITESKKSCFQTKEMEKIFIQCQYDIDMLLARLEEVHEQRISSTTTTTNINNDNNNKLSTTNNIDKPLMIGSLTAKETLIVESRHFVTASKLFVKCATDGSLQLIDYLTECVGLLERMFTISEDVLMGEIQSPAQITCLVDRLKEVAATYAYTVDVVRRLVSHPNNDNLLIKPNNLDLLMSHATGLATSLSTLMRTLRTMN
uniref:Uncharacterized protein DDB_G0283357-like n=1 Tax=Dermatophagoides pteronyssinus TaxID=6956 RepID=A0A6P6XKV3_DERPT|nr:uncharacterized protein DDB_G0283357-like [Dermatophagoides pteronyssinus]